MLRQFELLDLIKAYNPNVNEDAVNRAYVYAMKMHGSQKRASGDSYFSHPIEVAGFLTKYRLDEASIITALLHDVIEDTPATFEEIEELFGTEIARLVDGVTKLNRIEIQSESIKQAENLSKFVLAMSDDIRVLLVKLADRVHNMRTLHYIQSPEKRRRIAIETMEIYIPLAERIGMEDIKIELDDLVFAELNPDARNSILARLQFLREQGGDLAPRILAELKTLMSDHGIKAELSGREKSPYSIWMKMHKKNVNFEQLSDLMAFRIVVDTIETCYAALGAVHSTYPMIPDRFKDYISTPKPNGYQSIHTGVIGPEKHRIEIQIRTHEMHEAAELGVAAHWQYKGDNNGLKQKNTDGKQYRWLRELLDILEHASSPEEFLEHTKLEMFQDQVFCFTPKGDLISLPQGATIVDFAYAVHSDVGDHCVGGKINGRIMPLKSTLNNGDQVEIMTSKAQKPNPVWESFVVTGKARASIRRFIRSQARSEFLKLGQGLLTQAFDSEGYKFLPKALEGVLKSYKVASSEDLMVLVGEGHHTAREILKSVFPELKQIPDRKPVTNAKIGKPHSEQRSLSLGGLMSGMAIHFAGCCHPLPGERIVGIVMTGKGITVHTIDCDMLAQYANEPQRWLDLSWDDVGEGQTETYQGRINLVIANETGVLSLVTTIIAKNMGNIVDLKFINRAAEFFELMINIEVRDLKHLTNIIAALRATDKISMVERARG